MQRNTLLEPNNFIPQWEAGGEEKKEVSQNLRILRKKYDNIHKFTQEKQIDLELIKVSGGLIDWGYHSSHNFIFILTERSTLN